MRTISSPVTRPVSAVLVGALVAFAVLVPATAARAADRDASTETELRDAVAAAAAGDTIRLTGDIGTAAARMSPLVFLSSGTLDLNGHTLTSESIVLAEGTSFTITDLSAGGVGTLDAKYGAGALVAPHTPTAAISVTRAHLEIAGGTVRADGRNGSGAGGNAGIGGRAVAGTPGTSVSITGGTVIATANTGAAIGTSTNSSTDGPLPILISGGTVTATAASGAGIGSAGGDSFSEPTVTIEGGNVTARSDTGAGIGAGGRPAGYTSYNISDVVIRGTAVVDARSTDGAGIGGGLNAKAKSLTIGQGADVTAYSGNALVPAVGSGRNILDDGALTVDGTLRLPLGAFVRALKVNAVVNVVGPTGVITGEGGLRAGGVWNNEGAITLPNDTVTAADININHFNVTLVGNLSGVPTTTVRVLAPTFTQGDRVLPGLASAAGWAFTGWNTAADGSGTAFTADTVMTPQAELPGVDGTAITLYGQWAPTRISVLASPGSQTAGGVIALSAQCFGLGNLPLGDCTNRVTFSSDEPSDVPAGASVTVTKAGPRIFTGAGWGLSATTTASVAAAAPVSVRLEWDPLAVVQFGTARFTTFAIDQFGNETDVTASAVLTALPNDVAISGNSVTFPSVGAYTVTSTLGALLSAAPLSVTAAPVAVLEVTAPATAGAGDTFTVSAEGLAAGGQSLGDVTGAVTFTSSIPSDVIAGDQVTVSVAGTRTLTATLNADPGVTGSAPTRVTAAAAAELRLHASTLSVAPGDTVTFTSTIFDAFGNEVADVSSTATLGSAPSSPTISAQRVTFTGVGSYAITSASNGLVSGPVTITVTAAPLVLGSIVVTAPSSAMAGDTITLRAEGFAVGGESMGDYTGQVTFSSSNASDLINGAAVRVTQSGERSFTATLKSDTGITASAVTSVVASAAAELRLVPSARSVAQGSSLTFTSTVVDAHGNPTGDATENAVLSSDVETDIIEGSTVTFPHASPHVITSTLGTLSASVEIEVVPTAVTPGNGGSTDAGAKPLVKTGAEANALLALGALLLLLGAGLVAVRLRRRSSVGTP